MSEADFLQCSKYTIILSFTINLHNTLNYYKLCNSLILFLLQRFQYSVLESFDILKMFCYSIFALQIFTSMWKSSQHFIYTETSFPTYIKIVFEVESTSFLISLLQLQVFSFHLFISLRTAGAALKHCNNGPEPKPPTSVVIPSSNSSSTPK